EQDLLDCESVVRKLQARVRAVSGPAAEGVPREWAVSEAVRPEPAAGVVWEIVPGEMGEGLDVEGIEQRLREALADACVGDLAAARVRYTTRLKMSEQIVAIERQLRSLAPDGLDALQARAAALGTALVEGPVRTEAAIAAEVLGFKVAVKEQDDMLRAA